MLHNSLRDYEQLINNSCNMKMNETSHRVVNDAINGLSEGVEQTGGDYQDE